MTDWSRIAVLARSNSDLAQVRALTEQEGIPVRWCVGQNGMPALHQVREIHGFLRQLSAARTALVRADDLLQRAYLLLAADPRNPWLQFLRRMLEAWRHESDNAELPAQAALEFLYETCAETRRDFSYGEGVVLSTVHSAKGTEYDHVLLIGAWPLKADRARQEEERRAFYVGMTRARQTLTVFDRAESRPSLPETLSGPAILRREHEVDPLAVVPATVRYAMLGLEDIYLGYPATFKAEHRIHTALARLQPGDKLALRPAWGDGLGLYAQGTCVARLSRKGAAVWRSQLPAIREIRVIALIQRSAGQEADPARRDECQVDHWEVLIAEVILGKESCEATTSVRRELMETPPPQASLPGL